MIGVDTSIFIYQVEMLPKYLPLTDELFVWLGKSGNSGVTSAITMTELLVPGYREGDRSRIDNFYSLLTTCPSLAWHPVTVEVADLGAQFRATYKLKTPDALQAATAVDSGASGFVTNDPIFKRIDHIETAILDELL